MALKGACPPLLRATRPTMNTEDLDAAPRAHRDLSFFTPFHLTHWAPLGKISPLQGVALAVDSPVVARLQSKTLFSFQKLS